MSRPLRKLPFFLPFGGCRGRCVYCHQQTITGVLQVPPPAYVRAVLSRLTEPREVCYFGGSFCRFGRETVKAYLDAVVECAPDGSRIRFSTYPSDLRDNGLRATRGLLLNPAGDLLYVTGAIGDASMSAGEASETKATRAWPRSASAKSSSVSCMSPAVSSARVACGAYRYARPARSWTTRPLRANRSITVITVV